MGQEPVDAFDRYVQSWLSAGGQKIINEVNEWYRTVK
jgi:putative aldouronate transport system substrate-binding protein